MAIRFLNRLMAFFDAEACLAFGNPFAKVCT